jgi:hypothetical protein
MEIDFDSVYDAISLAGEAGDAVQKLGSGLEVIKRLFGTAKSGADPDVRLAMAEAMVQIANTKTANAQLTSKLMTIKTTLAELQAKQADFDRYELWETPAGATVYRLKESDDTGEPLHFLCPYCMETKRKSILQRKPVAECYACDRTFALAKSPAPRRGG